MGFWSYDSDTIIIYSMGVLIVVLIISIVYLKCRSRTNRLSFHGSPGDQMMKETINGRAEEDISDTGKQITHYQQIEVPNSASHGCASNIKCETNLQPECQQTVVQVEGNTKRTEISRGNGDPDKSGRLDKEGYLIRRHPVKWVSKDLEKYHEYNYPDAMSTQDRGHYSATRSDHLNPSVNSPDIQIHHHYHQGEDLLDNFCKEAHDRDYRVYAVPNEDSTNVREETGGYHSHAPFSSKTSDSRVYESRIQPVNNDDRINISV